MAEQKKQQVGSKKVNQLRPLDSGVNITVKVISKKPIAQRNRLAECLVGDETGIIILTARNDQGALPYPKKKVLSWLIMPWNRGGMEGSGKRCSTSLKIFSKAE